MSECMYVYVDMYMSGCQDARIADSGVEVDVILDS